MPVSTRAAGPSAGCSTRWAPTPTAGYIFLCGLLLVAACDALDVSADGATSHVSPPDLAGCRRLTGLRRAVRALAAEFFTRDGAPAPSNGTRARLLHGVDGIRAEALAGLPSVFDAGLPAFEDALARWGDTTTASYALLGVLMQRVEDTTAIHRCGPDGLARLRRDGRTLAALVASGTDPVPQLDAWNDEYRRIGLTMGGVADCMAVVFALRQCDGAAPSAGAL